MPASALQNLPIGNAFFTDIRRRNLLYVDKTDMIADLAGFHQSFFLARPPGFGRTLLLSAFEFFFSQGPQAFKGLKGGEAPLDGLYSTVRLDFSTAGNFTDLTDFDSKFCCIIQDGFGKAGFQSNSNNAVDLCEELSSWLRQQPEDSIVLLIDNYDAPLLSALANLSLLLKVRIILADFYSIIKYGEPIWRFLLISGITKFIHSDIFGGLNICTDLSAIPKYGSLLGFTDEELNFYFDDRLKIAAAALGMTPEAVRIRLRGRYGGYCFAQTLKHHVYSPSSVLKFLSRPELGFKNYRMEREGKSSALVNCIKEHSLSNLSNFNEEIPIPVMELDFPQDIDRISKLVLLTQYGFLTVGRIEGGTAFLQIPNKESRQFIEHHYS